MINNDRSLSPSTYHQGGSFPLVFIVWIRCGGSNVSIFIPLSPFSKDPWLNYAYIHGGVLIPSMVAGHWSPSSRQCSRCATHLAVMPFELLTLVLVHLPLLPFQSLWTWRGDDFCTVISFVITDTLYLVWLASRSQVPWWGHRCALPIFGAIGESSVSVEDQCSSPHPYQRCAVWQAYKGATPHNTPYTIHVSINVDRHVNFVRPSIRSHSVSFVFFGSVRLMLHLSRTIVLKLTYILLSLRTKF